MPRGRPRVPAEQRFWKYVNKQTGSDCWEWTGSFARGYGQITIDGKTIKAHRFSYEIHKGPIPVGMHILHSCDNRKCIRPDHLSIGTHSDNMRDKVNRNRQYRPKGSMNGKAILTEEQVIEIKNKINSGIHQKIIAQEYNIAYSQISKIKTGKIWVHVE